MDIKKHDEMILDAYVSRCIDNIIKHGLIKGVIDVKSFADFALPLDFDDDRLVEGIGQGAAMTLDELSDEERNILKRISINFSYKNDDLNETLSARSYSIEEWSGYLLELVHKRIRQRLNKESNE